MKVYNLKKSGLPEAVDMVLAKELRDLLKKCEDELDRAHHSISAMNVLAWIREERLSLNSEPESKGKDFGTVVIQPNQRIRLTWDKDGMTIEDVP